MAITVRSAFGKYTEETVLASMRKNRATISVLSIREVGVTVIVRGAKDETYIVSVDEIATLAAKFAEATNIPADVFISGVHEVVARCQSGNATQVNKIELSCVEFHELPEGFCITKPDDAVEKKATDQSLN